MDCRLALMVCLAACVAGCTVPLRCEPEAALGHVDGASVLDGRLMRCGALGAKAAADDADCQNAWAEARGRLLPTPSGK